MVKIIIEVLTPTGKLAVQQHIKELNKLGVEALENWRKICTEEWFNNWYVLELVNEYTHKGKLIRVEPEAIINKIRRVMRKNKAKEYRDYEIREVPSNDYY